jgi:hypothetical protein
MKSALGWCSEIHRGGPCRAFAFSRVSRDSSKSLLVRRIHLQMTLILHLTWILMISLRYAGVVVVFAGVGLFGVYFIAGNARVPDGAVPRSSWRGAGPVKGIKIVALGIVMLLGAYFLSLFMPDGL